MKTLKDFETVIEGRRLNTESKLWIHLIVYPNSLRDEVIKQIKEYRSSYSLFHPIKLLVGSGIVVWIKHFFNIAEEELR